MLKSLCTSAVLALSGALFSGTVAGAAPVLISQQGGSVFGSNGSGAVRIDSLSAPNIGPMTVLAGGFALQGDIDTATPGVERFTAFCLDIETYLRLSSFYTVTAAPFAADPLTAVQKANIQSLYETAFSRLVLTDATQSAGFQLALWEILYETGSTLTLALGNFSARHNDAATGFADTLLAGLGGAVTQNYRLSFLESFGKDLRHPGHYSQNLVTATPVPLPAAGLLLLAALGALGARHRRRGRA